MTFHKFWSIRENQKGYALIEVMAVLCVTCIIGVGIAVATVHVVNQGAYNSDYNTASRQTLNALHWISWDAQMAQTVVRNGPSGFPLYLSWVEWDNTSHLVTYTEEGDKMRRSYSIDGGVPNETVVGQYINWVSDNTTCDFNNGILEVTVTATVGTGLKGVSVTKVREVTPRPGL
jgi:hypothetical protein